MSLSGSKQFEEIVRKQGRHRKNQGVGFERKFNANGVEWEEDQYPKTKSVPRQDKYDPTSFKGTQAQDDLPPQDHKQKRQGQASRGDWWIWRSSQSLGQVGSQDYTKFYFKKYNYNSKDSHQDDVDPEEEELESSWGWLRQQTSLIFILGGQVQSTSISCTTSRSHTPSCC